MFIFLQINFKSFQENILLNKDHLQYKNFSSIFLSSIHNNNQIQPNIQVIYFLHFIIFIEKGKFYFQLLMMLSLEQTPNKKF